MLNWEPGQEHRVAAAAAAQLQAAEWAALVGLAAAICSEAELRASGSTVLVVPTETAQSVLRESGR